MTDLRDKVRELVNMNAGDKDSVERDVFEVSARLRALYNLQPKMAGEDVRKAIDTIYEAVDALKTRVYKVSGGLYTLDRWARHRVEDKDPPETRN